MTEILALDIGGTKIGWSVVCYKPQSDGEVPCEKQASGSIPTYAHEGATSVLSRIVDLASALTSRYPSVSGIAVASAGVVKPVNGAIIFTTDTMPGWGGTQLAEHLHEATGLTVKVLNDVHAHGVGEARFGAGKGERVVLSLAVGTGIGGAHIVDGHVVFGDSYLSGGYGGISRQLVPVLVSPSGIT